MIWNKVGQALIRFTKGGDSMRPNHVVIRRKKRSSMHDVAVFRFSWTLVLWMGLLFFHHFLPDPLSSPLSLLAQIALLFYCFYFSYSSIPAYGKLLGQVRDFLRSEWAYLKAQHQQIMEQEQQKNLEKKKPIIHEIPQSSAHFK